MKQTFVHRSILFSTSVEFGSVNCWHFLIWWKCCANCRGVTLTPRSLICIRPLRSLLKVRAIHWEWQPKVKAIHQGLLYNVSFLMNWRRPFRDTTLIRMLKGQSGSLTQTVCRCSQQIESYEGDYLLDYINTISYLQLGICITSLSSLWQLS